MLMILIQCKQSADSIFATNLPSDEYAAGRCDKRLLSLKFPTGTHGLTTKLNETTMANCLPCSYTNGNHH